MREEGGGRLLGAAEGTVRHIPVRRWQLRKRHARDVHVRDEDPTRCDLSFEDFEIEYRMLGEKEATLGGMARAYRNYQLERGEVKPLKERVKGNETLKYAVEALEIRIRQAWKPVPSPVRNLRPRRRHRARAEAPGRRQGGALPRRVEHWRA